jgi:hypothetical protein
MLFKERIIILFMTTLPTFADLGNSGILRYIVKHGPCDLAMFSDGNVLETASLLASLGLIQIENAPCSGKPFIGVTSEGEKFASYLPFIGPLPYALEKAMDN